MHANDAFPQIYRDFLDQLGCWFERTEFDAYHSSLKGTTVTEDMVSLVCFYCAKPFSQSARADKSVDSSETRYSNKLTYCNNCKKSLPLCALCAQPMGSKATIYASTDKSGKSNIDSWFSWCLSCKHGGHVVHINEWFDKHKECPVLGCRCNCKELDRNV
ncbi:hypothetical protein GJ496_010361 [Pomphorhynchus laevis]|nr:hypothetical protein GJ496_010361 [Pomphorhynchus laevis]